MQNFISSSDLLCWNIVLKRNSTKSMTTNNDGNLKIRPPITVEEHQQVQRELKARTILLSALPDEHMGDFYHMIDARDIWNAIKARFGGNAKGLPPSWSGIALILKTKGGLEYISFDDLYNKLKFLEIDTKGYLSSSSTLSNAAFVSIAGSSQGHLSYQESGEVVSADDAIPAGVCVSAGDVASAAKLIDQAIQEKQELMTKLDNEIANQAKWNNSGKNLYKLINSSISVRTKRGLGLDKYIREGELGIDDSKVSILHTNSDELKGQPIYSVDHIKAVPAPLTGNYMPPSNIPDIDESRMVYGKKATDSSKIKTNDDSISHSNDYVLFD
nr:xylulose kinase-1 [Tanacetum cinerariifolium]